MCQEGDGNGSEDEGSEPLTSCNGCGVGLHDSCSTSHCSPGASRHPTAVRLSRLVEKGNVWSCEECNSCDVCADTSQEDDEDEALKGPWLLDCWSCKKYFHLSCLNPPLAETKKPKAPWR